MLTIDTSILMYKSGGDHPLKAPCTQLLQLISDGDLEAMTTPEAIQEFAHIYARHRGRRAAADRAAEYAVLLASVPRITHVFPDEAGIASLIEQ